MANSQPKVGGLIPEAVRLERVRRDHGLDSIWNFWKELCSRPPGDLEAKTDESGDYQISYEAVRNYHYNRHAPGHYYAQVAAVFGVRLEWLLGAGGGMTHSEDNFLRAKFDVVDGVVMWPDWSDEQRREAKLLHILLQPEPHKAMHTPIPTRHERQCMITFVYSWVRRRGADHAAAVLTGGEDREPTEQDVADFYGRVFLEPLAAFAVDQQRLAAFHSRMSMMWLQDLAGDPWWQPPAREPVTQPPTEPREGKKPRPPKTSGSPKKKTSKKTGGR